MKLIALLPAAVLMAAPAIAGPVYYNPEVKSSFKGYDYGKTVFYNDIGFENKLGKSSKFYLQTGIFAKRKVSRRFFHPVLLINSRFADSASPASISHILIYLLVPLLYS